MSAVLLAGGCSSFASLDTPTASETSDGSSTSSTGNASGTTSGPAGSSGGGTVDPSGDPTDASGAKDTEPDPTDPAESSAGSTSGMDSTGAGEDSTGGSESTGPGVVTCDDLVLAEAPPLICSETAVDGAWLSVFNDCLGVTIDVFWVGYDCVESYFGSAGPGTEFTIGTFETHPWRVRNAATGELMREIPPLEGDTTVSVLMR